MSGRVFAIADLHFGHVKVAQMRGFATAQEHDDAIVAAWNRTLDNRDVCYVLGDVFSLPRVPELRGVKKLAPGNHDLAAISRYAALFSKVQACFEFDGCLLTHIPVHESQFSRWHLNVHGHTHQRVLEDRRYVCVSAEQCPGLSPVPLRELIDARRLELYEAGGAIPGC